MSISSIENLSEEVFYEIFDYLDGIAIYNAFTNLNHRFQALLNCSSLLFKIKLDSISDERCMENYKQFLLVNRHDIFSIYLWMSSYRNHFYSSFTIDSSFDRLESLVLLGMKSTMLISFLPSLISAPRLFSLTIDTEYPLKELINVYRLIFSLPKLKYVKCTAEECYTTVAPSMVTNKQFSTIEHLVIDHSCTLNELFAIIFHSPRLCHLNCTDLYNNDDNIKSILPIRLFNLTSISIRVNDIMFYEFEMFIKKISSKLKVLRVITLSEDMDYLDANRWERLILKDLSQLETFSFQYFKQNDPESGSPIGLEDPNQFTSSFWIERKWILETEMDAFEVVYSIHPYKERCHDVNSSIELCKSTRFTLTHLPRNEELVLLKMNIRDMLTITQIYHLEIPREKVFVSTLIDLLYLLREVRSLKIHSLSLSESKDFLFISNKNQKLQKFILKQ